MATAKTVLRRIAGLAIVLGILGVGFLLVKKSQFVRPPGSTPRDPVSGVTAPEPPIAVARRTIPGIVARVYKALDEGSPSSLKPVLAQNVQNNFQLFDSICKPYTYRAHYIENIVERPNNVIEVWVRVLFKPLDEQAYTLLFRNQNGSFVLGAVANPPPNWFDPEKEQAAELVHQFVSAAQAGRSDVLPRLVTAGMPTVEFTTNPCWKLQLHKFSYEVPRLGQINLKSYKGLKAEVNVDGPGTFFVEPVNGEYKIVGAFLLLKNPYLASNETCNNPNIHGVEDPNLETRTLERFHLHAGGEH